MRLLPPDLFCPRISGAPICSNLVEQARSISFLFIPRILYAADTYLLPIRKLEGRKALAGSVGHIKKLAQVQRQAVLIIAGAMRTSASDAYVGHGRA